MVDDVRRESDWSDGRTLAFDECGPRQFVIEMLGPEVRRGAPGHCKKTGRRVLHSFCLRAIDVAQLEIAICNWHALAARQELTVERPTPVSLEQLIAAVKDVRDIIVGRYYDDVSDQQQRQLQEMVALLVIVMRMLGGFALQRQAEARMECNMGMGVVFPFIPKNGGGK